MQKRCFKTCLTVTLLGSMLCLQACGPESSPDNRLDSIDRQLQSVFASDGSLTRGGAGKAGASGNRSARSDELLAQVKPAFDKLRERPHRRLSNGDVVYELDASAAAEAVLSGTSERPHLTAHVGGIRDLMTLDIDTTVPSLTATLDVTKMALAGVASAQAHGLMVVKVHPGAQGEQIFTLDFPDGLGLVDKKGTHFAVASSRFEATVAEASAVVTMQSRGANITQGDGTRITLPRFESELRATLSSLTGEPENTQLKLDLKESGRWAGAHKSVSWADDTGITVSSSDVSKDSAEVLVTQGELQVVQHGDVRTYRSGDHLCVSKADLEDITMPTIYLGDEP